MIALSKSLKKTLQSLADSKGRKKQGLFMVEGTKCVLDTFEHFQLKYIIATHSWINEHKSILPSFEDKIIIANRGEIGEISSMSLAPDVISVYFLPDEEVFDSENLSKELVIALDRIQDPGNLGTIMRTADWMGVSTILASKDTVDCFNPKVVQASMGAISRVKVIYGDLALMLAAFPQKENIFGTFLDGENIYSATLPNSGVIVMGNEGSGISAEIEKVVGRRISIPSYPAGRPTSESLNVAIATAITLSQFRSNLIKVL